MVITGNIITADEGKALHRKGTETPTTITRVALAPWDAAANWEDCDYGEPEQPSPEDVTEADKDAALRRFGVEV